MASVIRAIGFSNSLQQLVWPTTTSEITAYVWGAGGGGGGNDSGSPGGSGGGSGFARKTFTIENGDVLQVGVAGAGGPGGSSQGGAPGGGAGPSYTASTVWTTLNLTGSPYIRVTNGAYVGFLNQYGVWNYTPSASGFDHTVTINFASSGYYNLTGACDNAAAAYIDNVPVLDMPGFQATYSASVYVTAGNHSLRLNGINTGGPGSLGFTITGGASFGGGNGSAAGRVPSSGGGGGGGGASVIFLNGTPIVIAGGGAGGGGAGNDGGGGGRGNAPGPGGQTTTGIYAGQNGGPKAEADGGGGGGGGGGYAGGNGGPTVNGDQTAYAGYFGSNLGDIVANPNAQTPGGTNQPYYSGAIGYGGSNTRFGGPGYVVLDINVGGGSVKYNGDWESVQKTYVKTNGVWQPVQATYIKDNGVWSPINGSFAPVFTTVSGFWGTDPRTY